MICKIDGFDLHWKHRIQDLRLKMFAILSLGIALLIIYSNSFYGDWHFDDFPNIVQNLNVHIKSLSIDNINQSFHGVLLKGLSRPLSYLSFALNYYFGGLSVFGYHIVNFIIHYLAAIFLFLFIYNTINLPLMKEKYKNIAYPIALLATFLWALHPIHVTSVTYIVQRMSSMAALFYIISMYFYLKGRTAKKLSATIIYFIICFLSGLASVFSKENTVMLPFSILLFDLFLIQGMSKDSVYKSVKIIIFPFIIIMLFGFLYNGGFLNALNGYGDRNFSMFQRLLTEPRVIIFYLSLLFYPVLPRLTLLYDIDVSRTLVQPWTTMPAIILIIMMIGSAFYISRKQPLISFCIIFYFLNHFVESSIFPLELIFEHRNYLPSMFLFVPVALFIIYVVDYFSYKRTVQMIMVAGIVIIIAAEGDITYQRNAVVSNEFLLWADNILKYPNLSRPYNNLGDNYLKTGYIESALLHFQKAMELNRWNTIKSSATAENNIGGCYFLLGKNDLAFEHYQKAIDINSNFALAFNGMAKLSIRKRDLAGAYENIYKALNISPSNAEFHETLSFIFLKEGLLENASKEAQKAIALDPEIVRANLQLAEIYRKQGKYEEAIKIWERFLKKEKMNLSAHLALIELYTLTGKNSLATGTAKHLTHITSNSSLEERIREELLPDPELLIYHPDFNIINPVIKTLLINKTNDIN